MIHDDFFNRARIIRTISRSVATLESRVLVSARRLRDLKAAPEDMGIEAIGPMERTARTLQAVELALADSRGEDASDHPSKVQP